MKFRVKKNTRLGVSLLVSAAFIALAVFGWGLPIATAALFLLICTGFLAVIVLLGAGGGWLLRRWQQSHDREM